MFFKQGEGPVRGNFFVADSIEPMFHFPSSEPDHSLLQFSEMMKIPEFFMSHEFYYYLEFLSYGPLEESGTPRVFDPFEQHELDAVDFVFAEVGSSSI